MTQLKTFMLKKTLTASSAETMSLARICCMYHNDSELASTTLQNKDSSSKWVLISTLKMLMAHVGLNTEGRSSVSRKNRKYMKRVKEGTNLLAAYTQSH